MTIGSVFRVTWAHGDFATAFVTVTVMATATYTEARCPHCNRFVVAVPGVCQVESRSRPTSAQWSGRGVVVVCKRCGTYVEVISHG